VTLPRIQNIGGVGFQVQNKETLGVSHPGPGPHPFAPPLLPPSSHAPYLDPCFSSEREGWAAGESIGTNRDTQVLKSGQVDDPNAPDGKRGKRLSKFALRQFVHLTITVTSP
jgi:hypothetical protein